MSDPIRIDRLGHLGDGIAPGPVFVARALPGETVTGEFTDGKLAAPRILDPSPRRVRPACPHYSACGGCAVLHADDAFVADWKTQTIAVALEGQGLSCEIRPIQTSPPQSRRRAALSGRRTKKGAIVGFHGRQSGAITPVPECQVLNAALLGTVPFLEAITRLAASRKAELSFTVIDTPHGADIAVRGGRDLDRDLERSLSDLAQDHAFARLSWNDEVLLQRAAPALPLGTAQVVVPPGAFLQATREGEAALFQAVQVAVGEGETIADLFAGCGTFALPLAARARVQAVEGEAAMLAALDAGWRGASGLKQVTTSVRDLFRRPLLSDELAGADAVVIDPPRAGALAQTAELAKTRIPRIAAVSCNPVTFARDAALLVAGGYRLDWVQPVDQFRWSHHVELAAQFSRS